MDVNLRSARLEEVAIPAQWAEEMGWTQSNDQEQLKV
jgi:hypothetical protein